MSSDGPDHDPQQGEPRDAADRAVEAADGPRGAPRSSGTAETVLTVAVAVLALLNVAPLLAWVSDLGSFADWFRYLTLPALVGVVAIAAAAHRTPAFARLRLVVVLGAVGGLVGTLGYDLIRVPFVMGGKQVLAPIESYGVLLLDARGSSPLSGFAGWTYHFANGICFGIAYAAVGLGRSKWWAVGWSLVLETATVVTGFAVYYQLTGKWDVIAIAYLAHIPYGLALGWFTERPLEVRSKLDEVGRWIVPATFGALLVGLLVWHRPAPPDHPDGDVWLAEGDRFAPRWIRVPVGGCVTVVNPGGQSLALAGPVGDPTVEPASETPVCFDDEGVHRIKVDDEAWTGGFVIVDPTLGAPAEGPG